MPSSLPRFGRMRASLPCMPAVIVALLLTGLGALAQRGWFQNFEEENVAPMPSREAEFHFLRIEYTDLPQYHRGWGYGSRSGMGDGWWLVDWPDADNHFTAGIERLTRIDIGDPRHMRLTDERLFDYP